MSASILWLICQNVTCYCKTVPWPFSFIRAERICLEHECWIAPMVSKYIYLWCMSNQSNYWDIVPVSGWYIWDGHEDGKRPASSHPTVVCYHLFLQWLFPPLSAQSSSLIAKKGPKEMNTLGFALIFSNISTTHTTDSD